MHQLIKELAPWTYLIQFDDNLYSIDVEEWPRNKHVIAAQHHIARTVLPLMDKFTPEKGSASALDIGCNCGWFSLLLADQGYGQVTGIDINQKNVEQALLAQRLKGCRSVEFLHTEADDLVRQGRTFDNVVCMGVLNHLNTPVEFFRTLYALTDKYLFFDCYCRSPKVEESIGGDFLDIVGSMTCGFEGPASYSHPHEFELTFQYSKQSILNMLQYVGYCNILEVCSPIAATDLYKKMRLCLIAEKSGDKNYFRKELRIAQSYNDSDGFDFLEVGNPIAES